MTWPSLAEATEPPDTNRLNFLSSCAPATREIEQPSRRSRDRVTNPVMQKSRRPPKSLRSRWYRFIRRQVCSRVGHRWRFSRGTGVAYCTHCRMAEGWNPARPIPVRHPYYGRQRLILSSRLCT